MLKATEFSKTVDNKAVRNEIGNGFSEATLWSASWRSLIVCEFLNFIFILCRKQHMYVLRFVNFVINFIHFFSWANNGFTASSFSVWVNIFSCCGQEKEIGHKWSLVWNFSESAQSAPGLGAVLEGRDQVAAHTAQALSPPSLMFELMPEFWLVCYFSR